MYLNFCPASFTELCFQIKLQSITLRLFKNFPNGQKFLLKGDLVNEKLFCSLGISIHSVNFYFKSSKFHDFQNLKETSSFNFSQNNGYFNLSRTKNS
ncbi:hypothetical protein BpHYR1_001247 [Brachionus plicatilis]|uniref:Uncharacterized protein n=1 Tax=Brachionus plicatilis TaxID=10195 RepID=A0A3M7S4X3_BRAPC|nr:hypothetical protein BpHYR1_001247 [Brachionus plicatilis]